MRLEDVDAIGFSMGLMMGEIVARARTANSQQEIAEMALQVVSDHVAALMSSKYGHMRIESALARGIKRGLSRTMRTSRSKTPAAVS